MKLSVIIPTRNAQQYMKNLIDSLINQSIKLHEIIIIDTASRDCTKSICEEYDIVKFVQINDGEFDHGGTRNKAAKLASGDILVFMTQDAIPENEYFIEYRKQKENCCKFIKFDLIDKAFTSFYYIIPDRHSYLTMQELQAINEKVKELRMDRKIREER